MVEISYGDVFINIDARYEGHHYWMGILEADAIEMAYQILAENQTIEQVMNRVQSDIDAEIERGHGITHGG